MDWGVVFMVYFFCGLNDDGFVDVIFFYVVLRNGFFDGDDDDVVYWCIVMVWIIQDFDVLNLVGVGVVSNI